MQHFYYVPPACNIPIVNRKDEGWEVGPVSKLFALQAWGPKFDYLELI